MERGRVLGMAGPGGPGSGYGVGGNLVLTSAHVAVRAGERVKVFRPGRDGKRVGRVVWCGTPGGRDDAALVLLDDGTAWPSPGVVRWGRMVMDQTGVTCRTWGVPEVAQRTELPAEAFQMEGQINPGSGFVGNQYVMDLRQHPPQWSQEGTSPWGGLSGAAVFCDQLLTGVVASDRAYSGHGQLNVVPAYVLHHDPAFRAALAEHGGPAADLEAVEFQHLTDAPAGRAGAASPAVLLQADWQTVPFHGRDDELIDLRTWCGRDGFGAWLLHGPGGQGKTRLAHHLAGLLSDDNWAVVWPRSDADLSKLRELRHVVKPLLVVLDYAEARTGQLTALVEAAADHPGGTPFKVLLLARTDGDWWTQAKYATRLAENYLDDAPSALLAPLEQAPGPRAQAYRTAARALADALPHMRGLTGHDWPAAADTLPMPRLDHDAFANALTLQMTALADLLDTAIADGGTAAVPAAERAQAVEDRLLGHERRYWQHAAAARGLAPALSSVTLETALAAAHLVGAADREQADRTWSRLPALADQPRDRRDQVTAWIAALYPPAAPGRPWGALQPDRLAERHIGRVLKTDPAIAEYLISGADDVQTAQLLTVYSRAAAHPIFDGHLDIHLTQLCTRLPSGLASHVITTAIQADHPQPLIIALNAHASDPTAALGDLTTLYDQFPLSSQRLSRTAAHLAQAITSRYRALVEVNPDAHLPDLAKSLNNLSIRLGDVGRRQDGLKAIEEAVDHYRTLAKANPDAHLPNLASALNNLSVDLGDVVRRKKDLNAFEEAVRTYLPDLAKSLNNISSHLKAVGRRKKDLDNISRQLKAVGRRKKDLDAIRRTVGTRIPGLAKSLNNISSHLEALERRKKDLDAIRRTVGTRIPDLAKSLNNISSHLETVGRRQDGLKAIEEAVDHYRTLVKANRDAHLPDLASALNTLSIWLGTVGRRQDGLKAIEEAVDHYRALVEANRDAHLPDLASALNNLSIRLGDVGRRQDGLKAIEEAVDHYRTLAEANRDAHLPDLAKSLNNFSIWLGTVGRRQDGLKAIEEAVDHYRTLAEANRDAHLPNLAKSLNNFSTWLGTVGRQQKEVLNAIEESVEHYRTLAEANQARFDAELKRSLKAAAWLESLPEYEPFQI